jgi:hypothetical protein
VTAAELRAARMRSQRLDGRARDATQLLRDIVGVQDQDARSGALSIRARTEGVTAADVERALVDERSIVRMPAMRGTIHLVASDDAGWLHALLAPVAMPAERRAMRVLEISDPQGRKAVAAIVKTLGDGPLTRAELCEQLERVGIDTSGRRAAHLPRLAALEGHVCFGPRRGGKDTYVLVDDWLGPRRSPPPEDALTELARRYVGAYGPAEPRDFATWSGLSMRDAKAAWTALAPAQPGTVEPPDPPVVRMLPAFDTYLLGYRDRGVAVPAEHTRAVWPGGGIIHPTVVANGAAVATWRLSGGEVTVTPFGAEPDAAAEIADIGRFLAANGGRPAHPPPSRPCG